MGNLTKVTIELQFDDHPEPVTVIVGTDDVSTIQQTIEAIVYMEKNDVPTAPPINHGVLH